ncbi:hypothetical protein pipiens_001454 [Culex pipiens pipiens]|uniref:Uncharacterized protein n=1 Tax=Culex pipiens pipiens TaxID=38569 RepID=A0ABD1CSR5_CULPP
MKFVGLAVLVLVAVIVVPGQGFTPDRVLVRDKRTIQFLVSHLSQFFGLSNPAKGQPTSSDKQDNGNPLAQLLLSSAGKFSGGSGGAKKSPAKPKPFVAQFEIPSPERLIQEPTQNDAKLHLHRPRKTPTEAPEEAPEQPTSDSDPEPEAPTTIDPAAVNTLANAESQDDNSTAQTDDQSPQTPSASQQPQQFRRPAWSPFGATSYTSHPLPYTSYFGNNVFLPAPFIPQPFSHFGHYQQQQQQPIQPVQYHSGHPNLLPAASATSHSRVKMHDAPFDLVTIHGDANGAGSSSYYHVRKY